MDTFSGLLARHLETFRELERLQMAALKGVQGQGLEGLSAMLTRQREILSDIAREKSELRPYLEQWEGLQPEIRAGLRAGRPGEILQDLESVAQGIQSRHQEMFGSDDQAGAGGKGMAPTNADAPGAAHPGGGVDGASSANGAKGADGKNPTPEPDLSQLIHLYRALQ